MGHVAAPRRQPNRIFQRTALACAVGRLALGIAIAAPALAVAPAARAQAAPARVYDIPGGTLEDVLGRYGREAGIMLSFKPELAAGRASPGLHGSYTVQGGLDALLAGTGLQAQRQANGSYLLARTPAGATLPPVTVIGEADATTEGTGSYRAGNATVGSRTPLPLKALPGSVSVLTRQQMDDQNLVRIQDGLRYITGVQSIDYGDGTAYYRARGTQLGVQFDGVSILSGLQYQQQFDLAMYDRIEVLRGPAGVMSGAGEPAGTVNLVRKRPRDQFGVSTETQVGSFGSVRQMVDVTGPVNPSGTVRGRAVLVGGDGLQSVDGTRGKEVMAYGALDFDLTPRTTLSLSAGYQINPLSAYDYGAPAAFDSTLTSIAGRVPSSFSRNFSPDWNYSYTSIQEANGNLVHRFQNGWKSETTLFYRHELTRGSYAYAGPGATQDGLAWYTAQRQRNTYDWFGADTNVSGPVQAFGRTHTLTLGANYALLSSTAKSGSVALDGPYMMGTYSLYDPDAVPQVEVPFTYGANNRTVQYGVYAQSRIKIVDPLTLVLGAREAFYQARSQPLLPGKGDWDTDAQLDHRFLPSAGLVWDITPALTAYANYARFLSAQTQTSYTGDGLPPRTGEQYEAGVKHSFLDGRLSTTLAVFRINDNDRAVGDPVHPTGYLPGGKVRDQGVELEVAGEILPDWSVYAGYTYLNERYDNDAPDLTDGTDPKHLFKLWTKYRITQGSLQGLTLGGGMLAQSTVSRGVEQGGYAVFNAQVGYRFNRHVSASLQLNNIFDRDYYIRPPSRFYSQFGEGRNAMLTVRTDF